ncbi:MAG TPA: hypothetical protein VH253_00870 [Phycisphaerae bacterium]|nr:hypothetical protein [Phycisphaerae bacterium]
MAFGQLTSKFLDELERTIKGHEQEYERLAREVSGMSTGEMLQRKGEQSEKRAGAVKFAEECHAAAGMLNQFNHETFEAIHRLQQARWTVEAAAGAISKQGNQAAGAASRLLGRLHDLQMHLTTCGLKEYHGQDRPMRVMSELAESGHPRARELQKGVVDAGQAFDGAFKRFEEVERWLNVLVNEVEKRRG